MARREEVFGRDMQGLIVEVLDMLLVQGFGLGVGFSHGHELQKTGPIGVGFNAALADELPEPVHHAFAGLGAVIAEKAVAMVMLRGKFPGAEATESRNPDGRMGLLDRPWPDVDLGQLIVFAVPGEDVIRGPGLEDQIVGLIIALTLLNRGDTRTQGGVHGRSQRHPGD